MMQRNLHNFRTEGGRRSAPSQRRRRTRPSRTQGRPLATRRPSSASCLRRGAPASAHGPGTTRIILLGAHTSISQMVIKMLRRERKVLLQPAHQLVRALRVRRLRRQREQLPREVGLRGHLQAAQRHRGGTDPGPGICKTRYGK